MAIQLVQTAHNQEIYSTAQGMAVNFPAAVGKGNTLVTVVIGRKGPNPYPAGTTTTSGTQAMDSNTPAPIVSDGTAALSFTLTAAAAPVVLTLSAAANAVSGSTTYTGTITGGGSNAFAGQSFTVAGFVTGANNGTFLCTASTDTTLVLNNAAGVTEAHAGTATDKDAVYTGTITGGANNAFAGKTFVVTGFVASAGANNGTFACVGSSSTTLILANASAVSETHAGAAVTGGSTNWVSGVAFKSHGAKTTTGSAFTDESFPDLTAHYPAIYVFHKSVGVLAGEGVNVKSAYLGPQNGTTQDQNGAAGVSIFNGGVNAVALEFSGTASPSSATAQTLVTNANPARSHASTNVGANNNVQIAVGIMKNGNVFKADSTWTVAYMDKLVDSHGHFVVAYKILGAADRANFVNPFGHEMGVVTLNLT